MDAKPDKPLHIKKPSWLKTPLPSGQVYFKIQRDLRSKGLVTVCEEAKCPNIGECWNTNTATFMVLGEVCTRACRFCHVKTGNPGGVTDPEEPHKVAETARQMGLRYIVITMVDRDDMEDGGASHVAEVVRQVKAASPGIVVELLAGDFSAKESSLKTILDARPEVFAHNLETVRALTPRVRDRRATYDRSLQVLAMAKDIAGYPVRTKSSLMLGLGESDEQIRETLLDMRQVGVDFLTLGQYMRPTKKHLSIKRFVPPAEFDSWKKVAVEEGFVGCASGPLVRSSYRAAEFYQEALSLEAAEKP